MNKTMNRRTIFTPQRYIPGRTPGNVWVKYLREEIDPTGLVVKTIDENIGKGLFAEKKFPVGSFLIEYHGELITKEEGVKRERSYPADKGSFLLYFKSNRREMCIDATFSTQYGRFVNDGIGKDKNADLRVVFIDAIPHVALFASKNICKGDEIRYDYGVDNLHWRHKFKLLQKEKNTNLSFTECRVLVKRLDSDATTCEFDKEDGTRIEVKVGSLQQIKTQREKGYYSSHGNEELVSKYNINEKGRDNNIVEGYDYVESNQANSLNDKIETHSSCNLTKKECKGVGIRTTSSHDKHHTGSTEHHKESHATGLIKGTDELDNQHSKLQDDENCGFDDEDDKRVEIRMGDTKQTTLTTSSHDKHHTGSTEHHKESHATGLIKGTVELDNQHSKLQDAEHCDFDDEDCTRADIKIGDTTQTTTLKESGYDMPQGYDFVATKITNTEKNAYGQNAKQCRSAAICLENVFGSLLGTNINQGNQLIKDDADVRCLRDNNVFGNQNEILTRSLDNPFETGIRTATGDNDIWASVEEHNITPTKTLIGNEDTLSNTTIEPNENKTNVEDDFVVHCIVIEDASSNGTHEDNTQMSLQPDIVHILQEHSVHLGSEATDCISEELNTSSSSACFSEDQKPSSSSAGQKNSKSYSKTKPHRPCPYCFCNKSALSKHLRLKHRDEIEVIDAMKLPSQDRNRAFQLLKRKGIMAQNMKQLRSEPRKSGTLLRERACRSTDTYNDELMYCSKCFGFFSKSYFHRHRKTCHLNERSVYLPHAVAPECIRLDKQGEDKFTTEVLGPMHNDDVGHLCKRDAIIVSFGRKQFGKLLAKNSEKYEDKKTHIRSELRRLGHLYKAFKDIGGKNGIRFQTSLEMYNYENFDTFREAVDTITGNEDGSTKCGLKKDIGYLIKRVCKFLHGKFSVERNYSNVGMINNFLDAFTFYWVDIFGEAESSLVTKRLTQLRKPLNLPKQEDVQKLRDFTLTQIRQLTASSYNFIASSEYTKLRNLVVSRLTLFNARRGGEPCCLQISQWQEAENDVWIGDSARREDSLEKFLMGKFKIAYQSGKGGTLVSLLILDDCWEALKTLCDPEIRGQAGVHPKNTFVFPHTRYSLKHVTGWTSVSECCNWARLDQSINATGMRHYVATLYAGLDVKESERQTFYSHMGHSETINKNVYQSPLAKQTIMRVGKFLHDVDEGAEMSNPVVLQENIRIPESEIDHPSEPSVNQSESEGVHLIDKQLNKSIHSYPAERTYKVWTSTDTESIKKYFAKYIVSTENIETNKGSLPGVAELKEFIGEFPGVLIDLPIKERIKRLRSKIFNERKLTREQLRKSSKKKAMKRN